MIDPIEREEAAIRFHDSWPWRRGGVLIGGYAVAAYGAPRFSVDLDIVLTSDQYHEIGVALDVDSRKSMTFRSGGERVMHVERAQQGLVTVDFMVDGVVDRIARVVVDAEWVGRDAVRERLSLRTGRTAAEVTVARIEALWALKLLAARDTDISDLLMLSGMEINTDEVRDFLVTHSSPGLSTKIREIEEKLVSPKSYIDAISRLGKGRPSHPTNQATWQHFIALVRASLP